MKKTIITRKVYINAPAEQVWSALADFGNVSRLSPNLIDSRLTSDQKEGVGATRHCDMAMMGAQVEERIIEWNEGESMKIEIYQSKNIPMITGVLAEFVVTPEGDKTLLTGTFSYGMKNFIGDMLNRLTMIRMNQKVWSQFLAGVKHNVETGKAVNKETDLDLSLITG